MKTPLLFLIAALLCASSHGAAKLRDPTRPLAATVRSSATPAANPQPAAPVAMPELQLVLVGGGRRYAVIDGELLAEGESVRGLILLLIGNDAVVLKTPNGPRTLPLSSPSEP